jgi:hypothetical protein
MAHEHSHHKQQGNGTLETKQNAEVTAASSVTGCPKSERQMSETSRDDRGHRLSTCIDECVSELICPITHELPLDPVTAEDGHVYERRAIAYWLQKRLKSPVTNRVMGPCLRPATKVRNIVGRIVHSGVLDDEDLGSAWQEHIKQQSVLQSEQPEKDDTAHRHCSSGRRGFKNDLLDAVKWARRAALAGRFLQSGMHFMTAFRHREGNASMGLHLITVAAMEGSSLACLELGAAFARGIGGDTAVPLTTSNHHAARHLMHLPTDAKSASFWLHQAQINDMMDDCLSHRQAEGVKEWLRVYETME